jgi:hypothetical protein
MYTLRMEKQLGRIPKMTIEDAIEGIDLSARILDESESTAST